MLSKLQQTTLRNARRMGARSVSTQVSPVGGSAAPAPMQSFMDSVFSRSTMPQVALCHEFPGLPTLPAAEAVDTTIQTTTLANGLRVASCESDSPISSVSAFIDAGSSFETRANSGVSHFLEHIAFRSTDKRSDFRIVRDMQKLGGRVACSTSRELTAFSADSLREHMPEMVDTLGDVIQNQKFSSIELAKARERYAQMAQARQNPDIQISEGIHAAAFRNESLGLPLYAPVHNLELFTPEFLQEHVKNTFTANRMVVAGVGVDHADFVSQVSAAFSDMAPDSKLPVAKPRYTGGEVRQHIAGSPHPFAHIYIAFNSQANWSHDDLVPQCVLQVMMGQGGSFTSGGPGKGMYSRLNENVLNRHGWVESALSLHEIFNDSSLFGIYATADPQNLEHLTVTVVDQCKAMAGPVSDIELTRAKNQLKSQVHMSMESQASQLEDMGRQLLRSDKIMTMGEICAKIDAVKASDVQRVASEMLKTNPSVACYGDLTNMPRYDAIAAALR